MHRPGLKHANADVCLRHPLPTTVDNETYKDLDAGEGDKTDAVVAWSAEVWQGYATRVVVIARAARVQADGAANPTAQVGGPPDIWTDQLCMQRLVSGDMLDTASQPKSDRINKRVRKLRHSNGLLYCVFIDGSRREEPRPAERTDIVRKLHDDAGHFGIKQTTSLVNTEYW